MNNNSSGNGFTSGFLFGALIGAGVVFFLGTKKGKKLLKTITEEGLEGIAEIEDFIEDEAEEFTEPAKSQPRVVEESPLHTNGHAVGDTVVSVGESAQDQTVKGKARRLFRGIPRKN